jgi:nucleoside-diphosphate-sugar epimerase
MTFRKKRILVTGAAGFVGIHLCRELVAKGATVIGVVRNCPDEMGNPVLLQADLSNRNEIHDIVLSSSPDLVIHLASNKNRGLSLAEHRSGLEENLVGALNLLEACQQLSNITRFIFMGSCEEYGHQSGSFEEAAREYPVSAYGVSKLAVTKLLQAIAYGSEFPAVILRPSIVYGPGQAADMFLPSLVQALVRGQEFKMTAGHQTRDFVYVEDLIRGILSALDATAVCGKVINISSANPIRIIDLAKMAALLIGPDAEALINVGSRPYRSGEVMNYCASNMLAKTLLNWTPRISMEEGLRQTISHCRTAMKV